MILGIYGAGGFGREVWDILSPLNKGKSRWTDFIYIDDTKDGEKLRDIDIVSFEHFKMLYSPKDDIEIIISVVEPINRKLLGDRVRIAGYKLATIIHPDVLILDTTKIGNGVIIGRNAFVQGDNEISDNVLLQPRSFVSHDCFIGENSTISTDSLVGGYGRVGKTTFIGLGTKIKQKTSVGDFCIIGMMSAVQRDIPDGMIALGNPARPMKKNEDGKVFK